MAALVGIIIALAVGVLVGVDAKKHRISLPALWGVGVFMVLILVLPAYLIVRYRHVHATQVAPVSS